MVTAEVLYVRWCFTRTCLLYLSFVFLLCISYTNRPIPQCNSTGVEYINLQLAWFTVSTSPLNIRAVYRQRKTNPQPCSQYYCKARNPHRICSLLTQPLRVHNLVKQAVLPITLTTCRYVSWAISCNSSNIY